MKSILGAAIIGFLGLSTIVAGPMSLNPDYWQLPVGNGGGFDAVLDSKTSIVVYCVDYRNHINLPDFYMTNESGLGDLSKTRYGTTAQAAFSVQTAPDGLSLGDAYNRYLLAGWLVTQYDSIWNGTRDLGIQNAIWTMLDVAGAIHNAGDQVTWLNNAVTWEANATQAQIQAVVSEIRIYTSTNVAGLTGDDRYTTGKQEMISIQPTPEPSSVILLGTMLLGVGFLWRRKVGAPKEEL